LSGVSVIVTAKDSLIEVFSDVQGNYKIVIPQELLDYELTLFVSYAEYVNQELKFSKKDLPITKNFSIYIHYLMGDTIMRHKPQRKISKKQGN
jgi:hypothetical protein